MAGEPAGSPRSAASSGAASVAAVPHGTAPLAGADLWLYVLIVLVWGTSWIGIKLQAGPVAPEVSVLWRFLIAAPLMYAWARLADGPRRFRLADHARFLGMGLTLCSMNLILFYRSSLVTPSGLMSVVFSLASIFNAGLAAIVFGQRLDRRVLIAGLVGVAGVALMFAPEIMSHEIDRTRLWGLALSVAATLSFCTGNIISAAAQRRGLPVLTSTAWAMFYGVVVLGLVVLVARHRLIIDPTFRYLAALVWLTLVSSVIAFAGFLTLVGRIGAARAGYMTVLFPVVALAASTLFEGYRWTPVAVVGLVLVLAGNLMVLRRRPG